MNTNDLLLKCCALIEEKLSWGSSEHWQNQDFEALGTLIAEQTEVVLSVSTLKRIWGKVKYDSLPSATTLNTLAIFAGYKNWRAFRSAHSGGNTAGAADARADIPAASAAGAIPVSDADAPPGTVPAPAGPGPSFSNADDPAPAPAASQRSSSHTDIRPQPPATRAMPRRRLAWLIVPAILILLALAGWMFRKSAVLSPAAYSFSSQPLAAGIPNSVVFTYNADAAGSDSVFIQQSWDPRRRFAVPAGGRTYTSVYYYPGFFKAKLVVGDSIVKEHGVFIPSNGWLAAVDQQPVPVYFSRGQATDSGVFHIPAALLQQQNIPLQPRLPELRYYYIGDMKGLQNDNFIFETTVRSEFAQGSGICQRANVLVHCENTAFIIPLTIPGCVGEIGLMLPNKGYGPQNADLSGFGCNMGEWVRLRCEVRNRQVTIWVNGKKAWSDDFTEAPARVVGVSYRFEGPGAVDAVRFSRLDGSAVLEETFGR